MYTILDIETTGGKYNEEGITEIAIHKFDGHKVVDKFISLINPEREIQPFVVNLTGINTKMLRTAPKFYEVAKRIVEITEDSVLVAHNAQFDYRILRTEFRRLGYNFERKTLCTVDLSKKLLPDAESYSLGKLVRALGIPMSDRHRANGDAIATLKLFKLLLTKDTEKTIIKEVVREETHGELSQRQLDIVEQMPSETGVYYMHDKKGDILFLGKSTNIKKRVNQHFTKSGDKARQLQKETKTITFEETGSELVALLKENEELLKNNPKYNPNTRKKRLQALYVIPDINGYQKFEIGPYNKGKDCVTTFNGALSAKNFLQKITVEFQLCPKLNGLEEAVCENKQNNQCLGACKGQETPLDYNQRVQQVLEKYSLLGKSIIIIDKGREIGEYSAILIKNGIFQGFGYYDLNHQINNIHILESIITPMKGDATTSHIIDSYLRKKRVKKIIDLKN
ncbi:GIY-YIG nuclease family protein [Maribacter polysiphoniae]|uniref:DNA polymerase-3 subunit epsilon n=1 Tax=Maribacter polysiphoniae TaxID=429344 RepID=A0A316E055_9FLAO|nr:exonuclease domain-containing protein [Maribacter polysiphoniae]MBD1261253.1 GIY-YIG nuclease family protein [Maribacter polysiphoniae]PWK23505.1 DNA polymerase-3 subunit epsilon [Maribacter polysiphoniae]